jgi:hypothetical protein
MGVERTYFGVQKQIHKVYVNHLVSTLIRQSWAAVPSNTRRIRLTSWDDLCGVCRYMFTNSLLLLISKPNSRRTPRVGRVWLAQSHTQAFPTSPSTWCVPNGQVGPRPSPRPIAPTYLQRAVFIQTCAMWVLTRLLSKNITRASGVNFLALSTHPQTKPRALSTAPTPPSPLQ